MAAKRFLDNQGTDDEDASTQKRLKPSLAYAIREVVMAKFSEKFCSTFEPMLRRVVKEEVEDGLSHFHGKSLTRSPSFRIQAAEPTSLQLTFIRKLYLPIFTGTKIQDIDRNPLQLFLVDVNGDGKVPISLPYSLKIEIVVLDGDFTPDGENFTEEEFNKNVVKERTGKRPLLTGDLNVTMRDGYVCLGDIEFTDNSSWIRSRKFRVGARVVGAQKGANIRGAMTEAFVVKDHRGEQNKKHHPPALGDEVWRLEKIGRDGVFHKKLDESGINSVQEFLKLSVVDYARLRRILNNMSDKIWETTLKHARTCVMGTKSYVFRGNNYILTFDPICQLLNAQINGQTYHTCDLKGMHRAYIETLVKEAYANWDSLEEVGGFVNETSLITQGDLIGRYANNRQQHHHTIERL
ncbi:hypothetical protein LIER_15760 [Lithospermum erythrorhizon]|uniref:Uncharacterized protein n=1 Tax=Lithospermum erythrorhizon TaxID=34254 RepID=A0AAV3Q447_LITER